MDTLFVGHRDGLDRIGVNGTAQLEPAFRAAPVSGVAIDPGNRSLVYAATLGDGLYASNDGGQSFARVAGLNPELLWCVVVSASDVWDGAGAIYVGTHMSELWRSRDGGATFEELSSVQDIQDKAEWSFPPAPDTHHVHQITLDGEDPDVIVFGVELGGVYRSADAGKTWVKTDADPDPHTLRTHPTQPHRMYEGGATGYLSSTDGGQTWHRFMEGFPDEARYFYSLAVDAGDPDNLMLVGGASPFSGHGVMPGVPVWSKVFRRQGNGPFVEITEGLPPGEGTPMGTLAAASAGVFYYVTDPGEIFKSEDGGESFRKIEFSSEPISATVRSVCVAIP